MNDFVKMSSLVGGQFTISKVGDFSWKKWDSANNKMLTSDKYEQGFSKKYRVETDKGILDISQSQLASMLEGVSKNGTADINGRTFTVKSNGKTGMEIRYFINPVYGPTQGLDPELKQKLEAKRDEPLYPKPAEEVFDTLDDPISLEGIPF